MMSNKIKVGALLVLVFVFGLWAFSFKFSPSYFSNEAKAAVSGGGSGLIGHWTFDDGTADDKSGQGNHGRIGGEPAAVSPGRVGASSFDFDGTDDHVILGDISQTDGRDKFTISVWTKSSKKTGNLNIIAKQTSSAESWSLGWSVSSGGSYGFNVYTSNGGDTARTSLGILPDNDWHHIVGVYDGSRVKLYYDGVLQGSVLAPGGKMPNLTGDIKDTTLGVCIATWSAGAGDCIGNSGASWQGGIDDVRIYDRALTDAEVLELLAVGGGAPPPQPPLPGAPTVSITSPDNGSIVTASQISIAASAIGSGGNTIRGVQFAVDGTNLGTEDRSAPYSALWITAGLSGLHNIRAVATDSVGLKSTTTHSVIVSISGPPPEPVPYKTVNWTPPIGVPEPPFGIREDISHFALRDSETCSTNEEKCYNYGSGVEPYRLNPQGEPYTHYVNNSATNCDIGSGPFGTPAQPLCRVPTSLPAGSIVEIHGYYKVPHTNAQITGHGTSNRPVFIRSTVTDKAHITGGLLVSCGDPQRPGALCPVEGLWSVKGSYIIIENLITADADGDLDGDGDVDNPDIPGSVKYELGLDAGVYGGLSIGYPSDHVSVRHNDISGNLNDGTLGAGPGPEYTSTGNPAMPVSSYIVFYDNIVHEGGNYLSGEDGTLGADHGGMYIYNTHYGWIVDNTCYRLGSTCGRVAGGVIHDAATGRAWSKYSYIGRNQAWDTRESAFWSKGGEHIVFSQNTAHDTRDTRNNVFGTGMGMQYGPEDVWFLFNHIYHTTMGIYMANGSANSGQNVYIIGNVIHDSRGTAQLSGMVLSPGGSSNRYILNNTIYNVSTGMSLFSGSINYIANNIVSNITAQGSSAYAYPIYFQDDNGTQPYTINNNLFYSPTGPVGFNVVGIPFRPSDAISLTQLNDLPKTFGNIEANPLFVNFAAGNVSLLQNSPAIDAGESSMIGQLATQYQNTFGVDVHKDFLGSARPTGTTWDMGAYEYCTGNNCIATPPPTSRTLSVGKRGTGQGTISSTRGSIDCGTNCTYTTDTTTSVTLTAAPSGGSEFTGWSGACTGTTLTCTVNLSSSQSVTAIFTTICIGCDDQLILSNPTHSAITGRTALITWDTNRVADTQVQYGPTSSYGSITDVKDTGANQTKNHEVTLENLKSNSTYHYRVISKDSNGVPEYSADKSFTTLKYGQGSRVTTIKDILVKSPNYNQDGRMLIALPSSSKGTVLSDTKTVAGSNASGWLVRFDTDFQDTCNPIYRENDGELCIGIHNWQRYFSDLLDWGGTAPVVDESYFTLIPDTEVVLPPFVPPVTSPETPTQINTNQTQVVSSSNRTGGGGSRSSSNTAAKSTVTIIATSATPVTQTTTAFPYLTTQLLPGSKGNEVLSLQAVLLKENLLKGTYGKGTFDTPTSVALKSFQQKYYIVISGTPQTTGFGATGPKTRVKVNSILQTIIGGTLPVTAAPQALTATGKLTRQLSLNSKDPEVKILQAKLVAQKLLVSPYITGTFDKKTEDAVKAFQRKYGIISSGTAAQGYGVVGPKTREKLNVI